ncbi:MAG: hypothetical protein Q8L01_03970, partial [Candidatus Woesebacteria bacterium]|nr:hypothetical protein [Candidatus Woesebacteria bacterium]
MSDFKQKFENSFSDLNSLGFSDAVKFIENEIGVSVRKNFDNTNASLIKIAVRHSSEKNIEPLYISATYGRVNQDGITIRDKVKISNPIDLYSSKNTGERFFSSRSLYLKDQYCYDKTRNLFLKNDYKITPQNIIKEVYEKHIRTTKPLLGLLLRIRIWFWQLVLPWFFYTFLYTFFHYLLLLISGDRYTYNIYKRKGETDKKSPSEVLDNQLWKNSNNGGLKPEEKKGDKMDIFGYKLSQHAAVIYALINLGLYLYFSFYSDNIIKVIDSVFSNELIALFYVIVTLHCF